MDGGADHPDRRQVLPADLPQERNLHDAAVPRAAVRADHADDPGDLLARPVRVREPDLDHLARLDRGDAGGGDRPECRVVDPRPVRAVLPVARRPQGGGADRYRPGDPAGARRADGFMDHADDDRPRQRDRRLPRADAARARSFQHDPVAVGPAFRRSAGHFGADRRHVDRQPQLLGLQPVYHPARIGREEPARGAEGRGVRRVPQAHHAAGDRRSRDRRGAAGAGPRQARRRLSDHDAAAEPVSWVSSSPR